MAEAAPTAIAGSANAAAPSRANTLLHRQSKTQLEVLQHLVTKHITDASLSDIANGDDFHVTSTERGINRYEHAHLVAALDNLLVYQRDRRARAVGGLVNIGRSYTHDPRTRLIELLKRWLRTNATNASVSEDEVRRISSLCRDVLNHPTLFPSRNTRSFMRTLAEVYGHLQTQLREVLERDRTCAELAARALSLSRNLISDVVAYLLLAATDLKQTDKLPSLEVVSLWCSLSASEDNPLPKRADAALQKVMKDAWPTLHGSLIAGLLSTPSAFRLFDSTGAEAEMAMGAAGGSPGGPVPNGQEALVKAENSADNMQRLISAMREEFQKDSVKNSGLAGPFRDAEGKEVRLTLVAAVEAAYHLLYLIGEVLVHFSRISDGFGDYGMIRLAAWLHPFIEAITDKVQVLRGHLEKLSKTVDDELVLKPARGQKVRKPIPSDLMILRAHAAIERAITMKESHIQLLMRAFEELRSRSAPERLPHVVESTQQAALELQTVLTSPQFLQIAGDAFPKELPALGGAARLVPGGLAALQDDEDGDFSDGEESPVNSRAATPTRVDKRRSGGSERSPADRPNLPKPQQRSSSVGRRIFDRVSRSLSKGPQQRLQEMAAAKEVAENGKFPEQDWSPDASGLSPDGWVCYHAPSGRIMWHHRSLGPAPWEQAPELFGAPNPRPTTPRARKPPSGERTPQAQLALPAPPQPRMPSMDGTETSGDLSTVTGDASTPAPPPLGPPDAVDELAQAAASPSDLHAEVYRLSASTWGSGGTMGWKRHDKRRLAIKGGTLEIYEKGSTDSVKAAVDISEGLDGAMMMGVGVLSIRLRKGGGNSAEKSYVFEFCEHKLADQFLEEIERRKRAGNTWDTPSDQQLSAV